MAHLTAFFQDSPISARAHVQARVIFRTESRTTAELGRELSEGEVPFPGPAECVLEVGDTALAKGEIVERNGSYCFVATEVIE